MAVCGGITTAFSSKEFWPDFDVQDLVSLPRYQIYLGLMIDGIVSKPFSAETLPPTSRP